MKAIMIMFDSLNKRYLPPYNCDWVYAPNFKRLANHTVCFDNSYVGSMPCMPARRELHTGRYNFLHRSWGPLEPFDDSMPELLKNNDIYTHLVSDHYHYWEDGGCTYHTRYNSWEVSRGQEGDFWKGKVGDIELPNPNNGTGYKEKRQDTVNRTYFKQLDDYPQVKTFNMGIEFLEDNAEQDNWFLTIETFDPHEPFTAFDKYRDMYPHQYEGPLFDWPNYKQVSEGEEALAHIQKEYAALISMCDEQLGRVLDLMDENNLWEDTLLIVNTDHGYLLGEHGWWAKCQMPFYDEIAHTPLFIWDPRSHKEGERRKALVQTIDLAPTILDYFNIKVPADMQGKVLKNTIMKDDPVREAALFGIHGGHINCTNGQYVYMRAPKNRDNAPLYEYTLMPTMHGNNRAFFELDRLDDIEIVKPFSFTKKCQLMKVKAKTNQPDYYAFGSLLYDLENDPKQEKPIMNQKIEDKMIKYMVELMKENDAPFEQYERIGLKSVI